MGQTWPERKVAMRQCILWKVALVVVLAVLALPTVFAADQPTNVPATATNAPTLQERQRYQVQKGDVLVLDFPFTPEFNENVTVQPDGFISLRGIGDVHVDGQTIPQLTENLK